ncbi:MAG: efflux RND transporter periplasmic adaptor subunit [Candidatus Staskawiczbacteria bacterium]|nr:efflux RND transporter periplasmic adaptor subunit [Candidatus Staskawiczbacteria bacterium]
MKVKIPKFLKKKRNIWIIVILAVVVLIGFYFFARKGAPGNIQTDTVLRQNLQETVLATGQVVSGIDLNLGFQTSGIVKRVYVKEGDKVFAGQTLASLDQAIASANLVSAQGSLAQAQASFDKLLAGSTQENIRVYEDAVSSAQHDLDGSYNSAINTLNDAYTKIYNAYTNVISIQNSYFSSADQEGIKVQLSKDDIKSKMQSVKVYLDSAKINSVSASTDSAITMMLLALNSVSDDLKIIRDQCDFGVYYSKVTATDKTAIDTQRGYINTAMTNVTTSQQSIASYKIALQKAQHQLDLEIAPPTQADIDLAQAQILSAQGQVESARAALNNLIITAPLSGTITEVDIKVGEQATAMSKAIVLQDVSNLHTEANVSEANIADVAVGQPIDYTFDALGPDEHFVGNVLSINPASTITSGVVDYQIKGSLDDIPNIKPGMTANMTILVAEKENTLAVPSTAVINKNSKKYVRVVDDLKKLTYHEVEVRIGLQADGGLIEILSGLNEGQTIVTYLK